jgi:hypothetical protein
MTDTDPQTEALYRKLLMARSSEERFLMGIQMCESARATVLASLPPDLSLAERRVAIFRRYYQTDFTPEEMARIEQALRDSTPTHQEQ